MPLPPSPDDLHRAAAHRLSPAALLAFAAANTGAVIGYAPLLSLLLPIRIEALAVPQRVGVLSVCVIMGAVTAALSNIAFGWLSDRSAARGGSRKRWIAAGALATAGSYALIATAATPAAIVGAVMLFQVAINAVLAPLTALMADEIPDAQRGIAAGLLSLGPPAALGLSVLLVDLAEEVLRFTLIAVALAAGLLPLLAMRSRAAPASTAVPDDRAARAHGDLFVAWAARLLMLIGGNALSLYLLYYMESVTGGPSAVLPGAVARLFAVATTLAVPAALAIGRLSDRLRRRKPFLLGAALFAAAGLVAMARAHEWTAAAIGFQIYTVGSAAFLALHTGVAMQLASDRRHRGRDLGLLNLANTLPSLFGPLLAWLLAAPRDFSALMLVLAGTTAAAGGVMLAIRPRD